MSDLFWLKIEQMARLHSSFATSRGKPRVDDRRVLSGTVIINHDALRGRYALA